MSDEMGGAQKEHKGAEAVSHSVRLEDIRMHEEPGMRKRMKRMKGKRKKRKKRREEEVC